MEIFNYMSPNAKKVMDSAAEEARLQKQNFVGTEHILLALLHEDSDVSFIFKETGITLDEVREKLNEENKLSEVIFTNIISYTARAKAVLQKCVSRAKLLQDPVIKTEDIAIALLEDSDSRAVKCLAGLGKDAKELLKTFIDLYGEPKKDNPSAQKAAPEKKDQSLLQKYTKNLCLSAAKGLLDPVIGRENEINRILQILCRRTKNNPVLIGEPGVGKTVIVEGLAQEIVKGNVPEIIKGKQIRSLELGELVAGSKFRGEFEERVFTILEEVKSAGNIILFIDEIHTLVGAGASEGSLDAANILKPVLSRGEIQVIGATTTKEYKKHIEKDVALERRFQPITVNEPSFDETVKILEGLRSRYEEHHGVEITDEAIRSAVTLTQRYISDRFLPDKAIDVIDEASSRTRLSVHIEPPSMKDLEKKLKEAEEKKKKAVSEQNFEEAAIYRDEERSVKAEIDTALAEWKAKQSSVRLRVSTEAIADVVAFWTGIPVSKISENEKQRLMKLEEVLHERVIGQDEAVTAISKAVRRSRAGISDPRRPIGSFLFLGPTGVGKTELCKALADALFGDEDAMIRIDMSEYMEMHSVSKLIGSPPGYVGYDEGGQLTERVRRKPYSVILFDEVEKAHPDVFNIMLQILDDGRLTDSQGRTVNFRNTVIVLTSNAGASAVKKQNTLGFGAVENNDSDYEAMKSQIMEEVRKTFKPEFLNRLDDVIAFRKLTHDDLLKIAELMLNDTFRRIKEKGITVTATEIAKSKLAEKGYDPVYGARPLRRLIQKTVEDKLSECILSADNINGKEFVFGWGEDDFIVCEKVPAPVTQI